MHILSNLSTKNLIFVSAMQRLRRKSFFGEISEKLVAVVVKQTAPTLPSHGIQLSQAW